MPKAYLKADIKNLINSEIEIEGEIDKETLNKCRLESLKKLALNIEIPGFRKGQAPPNRVVEKIGEMNIMHDASENCISRAYSEIIITHNILAIGHPKVTITKLAPNNNLGFKIKTAILPVINLGDYKNFAKKVVAGKINEFEIAEKEVNEVIENIKKHNKTNELTEEFVKNNLGLSNIEDLKNKIKENVRQEKVYKEKSRIRQAIIDSIIDDTKFEIPNLLVESELHKMVSQFKDEIESSGMKFSEYLDKAKTSEEKIKQDWKPQAEKKAKTQLILNKIANEQNIKPDEIKLKDEVLKVHNNYPKIDRNKIEDYISNILTNELVFEFLENQK